MSQIRVMVTTMPPLHADIIQRIIREQPDMEIVGEVAVVEAIGAVTAQADPDVVLVSSTASDFVGASVPLVLAHPWLRVVALDTERNGSFVETRLSEWLTNAWPENLVEAIRRAATGAAATRRSARSHRRDRTDTP